MRYVFFLFLLALMGNTSCRKALFNPITIADSEGLTNTTIMELKKKYTAPNSFVSIVEDLIIEGVVTADDRSGNFYKQLILQDTSGAIVLLLDRVHLYTEFPIGRKIYVRCKDLMLSDWGGTIQLGAGKDESDPTSPRLQALPQHLFARHIVKGTFDNPLTPKHVRPADIKNELHDPLQSVLVAIHNVEAATADREKTLGDPTRARSAFSYVIHTCEGEQITLRTSSYAQFASTKLPVGNGTIIGIASVFRGTKQIALRSTDDMNLTGASCGSTEKKIPIAQARSTALNEKFPAGTYIEGKVISNTKNEAALNYVVQDESAGIILRFMSNAQDPKWKLGDPVRINIAALSPTLFNGNMQITGITQARVQVAKNISDIQPAKKKISEMIATRSTLASTLVQVDNTKITNKRMAGTLTCFILQDNDNAGAQTIETCLRTSSDIHIEETENVRYDFTGYVHTFSGKAQLVLRTQGDVVPTKNTTNNVMARGVMPIEKVRSQVGKFPANTFIEGEIISNRLNEEDRYYVVQDASAGVAIRFVSTSGADPQWVLHTPVRLDISGLGIAKNAYGNLQIEGINSARRNHTPQQHYQSTALVKTITQIKNDKLTTLAHRLVQIQNVRITAAQNTTTHNCFTLTDNQQQTLQTCIRKGRRSPNFMLPTNTQNTYHIAGYLQEKGGQVQLQLRTEKDFTLN